MDNVTMVVKNTPEWNPFASGLIPSFWKCSLNKIFLKNVESIMACHNGNINPFGGNKDAQQGTYVSKTSSKT